MKCTLFSLYRASAIPDPPTIPQVTLNEQQYSSGGAEVRAYRISAADPRGAPMGVAASVTLWLRGLEPEAAAWCRVSSQSDASTSAPARLTYVGRDADSTAEGQIAHVWRCVLPPLDSRFEGVQLLAISLDEIYWVQAGMPSVSFHVYRPPQILGPSVAPPRVPGAGDGEVAKVYVAGEFPDISSDLNSPLRGDGSGAFVRCLIGRWVDGAPVGEVSDATSRRPSCLGLLYTRGYMSTSRQRVIVHVHVHVHVVTGERCRQGHAECDTRGVPCRSTCIRRLPSVGQRRRPSLLPTRRGGGARAELHGLRAWFLRRARVCERGGMRRPEPGRLHRRVPTVSTRHVPE